MLITESSSFTHWVSHMRVQQWHHNFHVFWWKHWTFFVYRTLNTWYIITTWSTQEPFLPRLVKLHFFVFKFVHLNDFSAQFIHSHIIHTSNMRSNISQWQVPYPRPILQMISKTSSGCRAKLSSLSFVNSLLKTNTAGQ